MQTGRSRQLHCERAISGCDSEEHGTSRLDASQCYWWIQTVCLSRLLIRFACFVGWLVFISGVEGGGGGDLNQVYITFEKILEVAFSLHFFAARRHGNNKEFAKLSVKIEQTNPQTRTPSHRTQDLPHQYKTRQDLYYTR